MCDNDHSQAICVGALINIVSIFICVIYWFVGMHARNYDRLKQESNRNGRIDDLIKIQRYVNKVQRNWRVIIIRCILIP